MLIHGLASNLHLWDGVAKRLESQHRVVACDLRGHGLSPKPEIPEAAPSGASAAEEPTSSNGAGPELPAHQGASLGFPPPFPPPLPVPGRSIPAVPPRVGPPDPVPGGSGLYDLPTVAGDVIALIERLGLGACLLAGQSYGATVALQVAAERPDLTAAVVCVDGGFNDFRRRYPDWDTCRRDLSPPPLAGRPLAAIRFRIRTERPGWPEEGLAGLMACFEVREDGTVAPWLTRDRHLEVLHGLWEVDAPALWARVAAPVLLLAAQRPGSRVKSPWLDDVARCRALLAERVRAEVVWMDGDHDLHAEHPDQVARLIERWGRGLL